MKALPLSVLLVLALIGAGAQARDEAGPYLDKAFMPDGIAILPPPPAQGSPAANADRTLYDATRRLKGSPRWDIATWDVENAPFERYACAIGKVLTPARAPALAHLLDRAGTGELAGEVKTHYQAPRPYLADNGPICEPRTADLDGNGDYPSGHAANGWLEGLILARLFPERATQILTRARQYGESRIVCGVHSRSAVAAGWLAGSAMFATLMGGSDSFRSDMDRAEEELESIGTTAARPNPQRCAAEAAALATPLD